MGSRIRGLLERLLGSRRNEAASEIATDFELLQRFAQRGDQEAFELLVWRHGLMVLGLCQRTIRDEHLTEDAFQAVFLVLARKARAIRNGNVAGWLYRVARRVAARAARNRCWMSELPIVEAQRTTNPTERDEVFQILDAEVSRLPERLRRPLLLCYLGGRSTEDAARELGCPRGTILSRLSTARKLLADRLSRRGVTLPAVLPVIAYELNAQLVSATVTAALRFVVNRSPRDAVSLLAHGVIQNMTHNKQLIVLGMVFLVAGLIGSVGWVAAQNNSGGDAGKSSAVQIEFGQEPQPAKKEGAQQTKGVEQKNPNDADQQLIAKLNNLAIQLRSEIHVHEQTIRGVRSKAQRIDPRDEIELQMIQTRYNLERDLLLEEIREQAIALRKGRQFLNDSTAFTKGEETEDTKSLKRQVEAKIKELDTSKEALKQLEEKYLPEIAKYKARATPTGPGINLSEIESCEMQLSELRELLAVVNRQIIAAKLRELGVQEPLVTEGVDQKLDRLSREVRELRKELEELKKAK